MICRGRPFRKIPQRPPFPGSPGPLSGPLLGAPWDPLFMTPTRPVCGEPIAGSPLFLPPFGACSRRLPGANSGTPANTKTSTRLLPPGPNSWRLPSPQQWGADIVVKGQLLAPIPPAKPRGKWSASQTSLSVRPVWTASPRWIVGCQLTASSCVCFV